MAMALEGNARGFAVHPMRGLNYDKVYEYLGVTNATHKVEAMLAIGKQPAKSARKMSEPVSQRNPIDKFVSEKNFLKVLAGDESMKKAGKKVLESGPNDHVFIFFDDHGAPDLVAFPDKYLYAKPLIKTLKQMHQDKNYGKLVFYIEACESGSKKSSMSLADAELTRTINNKDFPLVMAQQSGDYHKLSELSTGRQFLDTVFEEYVNSIQHLMNANNDVFNTRLELNNRECYHNFVDTFNDQCLSITQHTYSLNKLYTFVNICEQLDDSSATQALNHLVQYCQQNLPNGYSTNIL
ncbi:unnamed protein product [Medioppia subpectinata]|uniref:Legumain prodomain domain-containing protein n=1 Tax=Medioppia subpectinata TaxID=1979941 RepID=A0A7R9Q247_9ACAR|nr:unnamed protein product [Medioppia subpectinata]CAG2109053.1 unnamed protein product [Medioppia subpectinata]